MREARSLPVSARIPPRLDQEKRLRLEVGKVLAAFTLQEQEPADVEGDGSQSIYGY